MLRDIEGIQQSVHSAQIIPGIAGGLDTSLGVCAGICLPAAARHLCQQGVNLGTVLHGCLVVKPAHMAAKVGFCWRKRRAVGPFFNKFRQLDDIVIGPARPGTSARLCRGGLYRRGRACSNRGSLRRRYAQQGIHVHICTTAGGRLLPTLCQQVGQNIIFSRQGRARRLGRHTALITQRIQATHAVEHFIHGRIQLRVRCGRGRAGVGRTLRHIQGIQQLIHITHAGHVQLLVGVNTVSVLRFTSQTVHHPAAIHDRTGLAATIFHLLQQGIDLGTVLWHGRPGTGRGSISPCSEQFGKIENVFT